MSIKLDICKGFGNPCPVCTQRIKVGTERVSVVSGSYMGSPRYNRYHLACFNEYLAKQGLKVKVIVGADEE